jgi:prepilin-type N-terminal cleavage/methylation domain-containing protein
MRIIKPQNLHQRGDTLVEVLVCIAILSLILGGAFILTNRSLQSTRSAQERVNAVKLVEAQLERIKNLANDPATSDQIFGSGVPASYCLDQSGAVVDASNAACHMGPDGTATATEPIFNLSVSRSGNTFTVNNVWNSVTGRSQETIQMKYRVYE